MDEYPISLEGVDSLSSLCERTSKVAGDLKNYSLYHRDESELKVPLSFNFNTNNKNVSAHMHLGKMGLPQRLAEDFLQDFGGTTSLMAKISNGDKYLAIRIYNNLISRDVHVEGNGSWANELEDLKKMLEISPKVTAENVFSERKKEYRKLQEYDPIYCYKYLYSKDNSISLLSAQKKASVHLIKEKGFNSVTLNVDSSDSRLSRMLWERVNKPMAMQKDWYVKEVNNF